MSYQQFLAEAFLKASVFGHMMCQHGFHNFDMVGLCSIEGFFAQACNLRRRHPCRSIPPPAPPPKAPAALPMLLTVPVSMHLAFASCDIVHRDEVGQQRFGDVVCIEVRSCTFASKRGVNLVEDIIDLFSQEVPCYIESDLEL